MIISHTVRGTFVGVRTLEVTQAEINIWNNMLEQEYTGAPELTLSNLKEILGNVELNITARNGSGTKYLSDVLYEIIEEAVCGGDMNLVDFDINWTDGLEYN